MTRLQATVLLFLAAAISFAQSSTTPAPSSNPAPTFTKDVAPILQKNCKVCHRPGEPGPFSMLTYEDTRPWAMLIKLDIQNHKMPPWFADPHYGKFSNAMSLTPAEIDTISKWADAGAPKGDPKDMPAPVEWVEGWVSASPTPSTSYPSPTMFPLPA